MNMHIYIYIYTYIYIHLYIYIYVIYIYIPEIDLSQAGLTHGLPLLDEEAFQYKFTPGAPPMGAGAPDFAELA